MPDAPSSIVVRGDSAWTDTGIDLQAGEVLDIAANGTVNCEQKETLLQRVPTVVGPAGTYLYRESVADKPFPLPAAAGGPAPAYALIGRIGDGPPFYVGRRISRQVSRSGRLYLGVNDYDLADNSGHFLAEVARPETVQPMACERIVPLKSQAGEPVPGSKVVVFYMDGLRPDVIREMAAMGHIPTINRLFVEGGAWTQNAFTAFPSDTITSNGTMWTGCFSDRHGLKGQVRFSRRTLQSVSYLEPLGPNRSARLLAPPGIDKVLHNAQAKSIKAVRGDEAADRWRRANVTGVPPLYQYLRDDGADWATGVLPMMTEVPPVLWTRSLVRHMPYLHSQQGWQYIDDANTHYALRHLLSREQPVTIIWLPETDTVSHKKSRGQFGVTRRTIALADLLIGHVVAELEAQGRLEETYLMLISDHGHHGGRNSHLSHFDIANELFFKPREVSEDGEWVGGGLGMSVRQHRFWNRHPEDGSRDFVFIDGDADGVARIFLPRGRFHSRDWMGNARPADLLQYKVSKDLPPVNLIDSLLNTQAVHGDGRLDKPVDLVLTRLSDDSILISTVDRGHAVVDRKPEDGGRWTYKYTPVKNIRPADDGSIAYDVVELPRIDPLGLTRHLPLELLSYYHDERTWLRLTAESRYPDSVVALTRHMLWQENLRFREREYSSDFVVTARPGWYFGNASSPGTMHGYPLADCMRATLFVCGPNVRRGARIIEPCRLADLTPTILEMTGTSFDPRDFDGTAFRAIYEAGQRADSFDAGPVYWSDVDLGAWQPLKYTALEPYEHLPISINRPSSPLDLNNLVYNALSIPDINVIRVFDDVLAPLSPGERPIIRSVERTDHFVRNRAPRWIGEAVEVLDLPGMSLGDYSLTSLGNLKRADRAIDWVQNRGLELDRGLAKRMGQSHLPGSEPVHWTLDAAQLSIWEVYRLAQRVAVQVVDETLINSIENGADRTINRFRQMPAEVIVKEQAPIAEGPGTQRR